MNKVIKTILIVLGSIFALFILLAIIAGSSSSNEVLPEYEITLNQSEGTTRTMYVVVPEGISEDQIIALNDSFYNKYQSSSFLFINYFNDKTIAVDYFDKINTVSEEEADEMFTHYVANFKKNPNGMNTLFFNENGDWNTLKNY